MWFITIFRRLMIYSDPDNNICGKSVVLLVEVKAFVKTF